ncbi:MAG: choice-of-anchor J domain-containing protein, partial [Pyrinomonadaceae bacterium]
MYDVERRQRLSRGLLFVLVLSIAAFALVFAGTGLASNGLFGTFGVATQHDMEPVVVPEAVQATSAPFGACVPFSEGFNDVSMLVPNGWFMQNNSQPPGTNPPFNMWFQGIHPAIAAQSGPPDSYVLSSFTAGEGLSDISNWLLTPPVVLRDGATFTFW